MRSFTFLAVVALATIAGLPPGTSAQEPGDKRFERWRHFIEERESPGVSNLGARLQAARQDVVDRFIDTPATVGAARLAIAWEPIGPVGISDSNQSTGRVSTIAIHPENPDIIYIGGAQGGVWRSDDGGQAWRPLTDLECSLAMGSIVIDPVDPTVVYAGTGELHFSGDSYYGCGVLRSRDGGESWVRLAPQLNFRRIGRLVIDPATAGGVSTRLFAAASDGLYRSLDSGDSWLRLFEGTVTDVAIDPSDPMRVWIGVRGEGIRESSDGGVTFRRRSVFGTEDDTRRVHVTIAPSDPLRLYAVAENQNRDVDMARSDDGGTTWSPLHQTGASCRNQQCWYDMAVAVDAQNPDRVYFGAVDAYRSDNAGATFERISNGVHVDQHFILSDPSNPGRVYLTNDGGVYRSENNGGNWTSLNTNLALTQFYGGISLHPTSATVTLGGTQDNGTLLGSDASPRWARIVGGDGGYTAINPTDPNVMYMETQWTGSGGPIKRVDGVARRMTDGIDRSERGLFIPPIIMDPYEPETLYFGATQLYRTTNAAERWHRLPVPADQRIRSIGPSLSDANTIYYGTFGEVFVTRDGGDSWTDASAGLPDRAIPDLAVHPTNPDIAWAVASGFESGHVFRTGDGGQSWIDVSGNLPDLPTNTLVLDPADPETVYIGTDLGVFAGGAAGGWALLGEGLPLSAVYDLAVEPNTQRLVAATHGRGMFQFPVMAPLSMVVRERPARVDTVAVTAPPRPDSLRLGAFGTGWSEAAWTAEVAGGAAWLQLDPVPPQGRGFLRWSADAAAVPPGAYQDEIVVRLTGTGDEARIPVRLEAFFLVGVNADRSRTGAALSVDSLRILEDSIVVDLTGTVLGETRWVAQTGGSDWLELQNVRGASGDVLKWQRDPAGLQEGVYADSIYVSVEGFPTMLTVVVDTLAMLGALAVQAPTPAVGVSITGVGLGARDSVAVDFSGLGADAAVWTVAHGGSPWFEFETSAGVGNGFIRWTRSAANLASGEYGESMVLTVEGHPELTLEIADTFRVLGPVSTDAAGSMLLTGSGLGGDQQLALDQFGNRDGVFNLGDFLAWLGTCTQNAAACGSGGGS